MQNRELLALQEKKKRVMNALERVYSEVLGPGWKGRFLPERSQLQLTNLEVWSERYQVPVEQILTWLLEDYREITKKRPTRRKGLPVTVRTLMSKTSEKMVRRRMETLYPNHEHREVEVQKQQEKIVDQRINSGDYLELVKGIGPEVSEFDFKSLKDFRNFYQDRITRRRKMWNQLRSQPGRPYRGNPWM